MAPRRTCCYRGDRTSSPDALAARHPILRRGRNHNVSSSIDADEVYGNSSTELSILFQPQVLFPHHRISEDSILPDPRTLGGGESPSMTTNPGRLTPNGLTRILRHRFSKESRQHFKDTRQQRRLQKKSTPRLKHKDSTVTMDDLVGLQLAQRTPSRGGYDADAQLFTDASLLARLEPDQNTGHASGRQRKIGDNVTTPLRQRRPIARMPAAMRGSPLIKVHKPSLSEESASDTVGRTSTSTYTFGTPGTPCTEEDTGTVATQTISSLDDTTKNTNTFSSKPATPAKVSQATDVTYKSSSGSSELQHPRFLNRLSLKDFSQSSLHLTGPLQRPETSLNNIAELADTSPAGRAIATPALPRKPYSQTHTAMRTSAPHLHDMRISQHLRSLSYYSDDAEQVPEIKEPEQETSSDVKQDTVQQPQATDCLAPKISLVRDESTKDKSSHSITRARNDSVMYDGQVDLLVPPQATGRRSSSISEDYEDTAAVWQKALNSYQAEKMTKDKRRASSSAATTGSPLRRSRVGSVEHEDHELHPLEPRYIQAVPAVELPHIDTEHSFAQVPLPVRKSIAHGMFSPANADSTIGDLSQQRVGSPWPISEVPEARTPARRDMLHARTPPRVARTSPAWARFAPEDTEERNGSAGIADNVITRDFAPPSPSSPANKESKHAISPKKKTNTAKVKKLLSEIPSLFKNRGPHNRQLGHRSSIAPGAELEFPELELLPGGASQEVSQLDAWKNAMDSGPGRERLMSMDEQDPKEDNSQSILVSLVGSSDYGSSPGSPVGSVTSTQRGRTAAPAWNDQYLLADPDRNTTRGTDLGSHLDGASKEWLPAGNPYTMNMYGFSSIKSVKSIKDSPGSKSLPPTLQAKWSNPPTPVVRREKGKGRAKGMGETGRPMLEKIASTEGLRRSTQDLNNMLERSARVEAERAVRAAESWGV